ncbi:MAG: VWA domain-containing protein [Planctomycetota bacterium]
MRRRFLSTALVVALVAPFVTPFSSASADFAPAEWKAIQAEFAELFSRPGFPEEKSQLLKRLVEDGSSKALKLVGEALVKECELFGDVRSAWQVATMDNLKALEGAIDGYTPEETRAVRDAPKALAAAEEALKLEQRALSEALDAVKAAPAVLRDTLFKRAKTSKDWMYRAAAARLAVMRLPEAESVEYLRRTMNGEKDGRVRSAVLDMMGDLDEGWETWTIDRIADPDWSIQLQAVQLVQYRAYKPAVPHLINALGKAGPRLAQAIGAALKDLTGENFEPFPDVWAKWWEEHRADFEAGVEVTGRHVEKFEPTHFYGLPIHSDRIIFVIDISNSMKLKTENGNPAEKWKAPPPTTGGDAPPPPPPPEEILSGPKIDVAKHELKKAIEKLPPETTFTIIAFNGGATAWKDDLLAATDKNKQDAFTWVRALKPYSSTYIEGALRRAFQIAGVIDVDDKYVTQRADTIVLMSDGAPTDSDPRKPKNADPDALLALVREWNKNQKVVIHTIGVDMLEYIDFLKKLAEQNGGTYLDR